MSKRLYVVGIGPGASEERSFQAAAAIRDSEVICGYPVYIELVQDLIHDQEVLTTNMRQEVERCTMAIESAASGKTTALVCSGDAGVYGMASLVLELLGDSEEVEVQIIPGITAAIAGAAVLGAPLAHDFMILSLSDLLTPWELIVKRLRAAAMGDLILAIYNPSSKKRADHLKKACEILLESMDPETVCGYVRNIGREGQEARVLTLKELKDTTVDMFTTVFIGNSQTVRIQDRMVTPRGYRL